MKKNARQGNSKKRQKTTKRREDIKRAKKVAEAQAAARTNPLPADPRNSPMFKDAEPQTCDDIAAILCDSGFGFKKNARPNGWVFDATWSSQASERAGVPGTYYASADEARIEASLLLIKQGDLQDNPPRRLISVLAEITKSGGMSAMAFYDQNYKDGDRWFIGLHFQSDPESPYPDLEAVCQDIIGEYRNQFGNLDMAYEHVNAYLKREQLVAAASSVETVQQMAEEVTEDQEVKAIEKEMNAVTDELKQIDPDDIKNGNANIPSLADKIKQFANLNSKRKAVMTMGQPSSQSPTLDEIVAAMQKQNAEINDDDLTPDAA